MTQEMLFGLPLFAFIATITPGPNNMMLLASGANFGFRRTIPHMLGIGIGFMLMAVLVGIGIMVMFEQFPVLSLIMKGVSVVYLLYLAWKIANAGTPSHAETGSARPLSFIQAVAFQWINPKAWAIALSAISLYAPDRSVSSVFSVVAIFGIINLPVVSLWTLLGEQMKRFLTNPRRLKVFNYTMAILLITSLLPILLPGNF